MSTPDPGKPDGAGRKFRIMPTEEDVAILQRQIRRIMRWDAAEDATGKTDAMRLLRALRNATGDYLEYTDPEPRRKST